MLLFVLPPRSGGCVCLLVAHLTTGLLLCVRVLPAVLSSAVELGEVITGSALERGVDRKQDPYTCSSVSRVTGSKLLAGIVGASLAERVWNHRAQDHWNRDPSLLSRIAVSANRNKPGGGLFSTDWVCLLSMGINFSLLRNIHRRKGRRCLMEEFSFCMDH